VEEERLVPPAKVGDVSLAEKLYAERESGLVEYDIWDCLQRAKDLFADREACVENAKRCTYGDLHARACKVGGFLRDRGIVQGDRVGVMLSNQTQVLELHYAIAGAARGAVLNMNQRLSPVELAYILKDASPRWLVVGAEFRALIEKAVEASYASVSLEGVLWVSSDPLMEAAGAALPGNCIQEAYTSISMTYAHPVGVPAPIKGGDSCEMYYTSGSTGLPKGVMLTHKMVVKHALGCMLMHRLAEADVWGHVAPMFHLVDAYAMFAITWLGGRHVLVPVFSTSNVLGAFEDHKVTVTNMAATMVTLLLADPTAATRDLSSLSLVSCGGAPLNSTTVTRAMWLFGCEFFCSYGMTECCGKISMSLLGDTERRLPQATQLALVCTSGKPFVFTEVRLVRDADFTDVALDNTEVGECVIRGDTVFTGYWKNAAATAEAFREGWFLTGDLGVMNKYGFITLTDRKKDMILTGSENVYSAEVEKVLHDHPAVLQACVYGIPNEALGELVKAMVVLKDGAAAVTQRQLQKYCQAELADYKVPRLIEFVDKLPMLGSGKIAKAEIKKREVARYTPKEKKALPPSSAPAPPGTASPAPGGAGGGEVVSGGADERLHKCTYRVAWPLAPLGGGAGEAPPSGRWVLVTGGGEGCKAAAVAQGLAEGLARGGATTEVVEVRDVEEEADHDALNKRFDAVLANGNVAGLVYLLPLAHTPASMAAGAEAAAGAASTHSMLRVLLALMQACSRNKVDKADKVRLVVVTRGAAAVPNNGLKHAVHASMQAVVGMARVVPAEKSKMPTRIVDLCPDECDDAKDAVALMAEVSQPVPQSLGESAWRARQRYAPALEILPLPPLDTYRPLVLDPTATYVITGATGGLGMRWTQWLVERCGVKTLVLTSRRAPSEKVAAQLAGWAAANKATIKVLQGDVGVEADTSRILTQVKNELPVCKGIFHLAGAVDDGTMDKLDWARFRSTLAAKVDGSLYLHEQAVRLALPLDHFVMFASIYGLLGYRELSHYTAANAFQEGLAHTRWAFCFRSFRT
jgi:acyl-CoA synthetase (AMP-forming)/AMP-acid ligase II/NAD(P)-dependent dehydrogenase (short-subunit alcohol dehydrogenase family)